ncbi:MAG: hypothetical protein PVS3B1_26060 [Ktedonobacteraceae bacterium]
MVDSDRVNRGQLMTEHPERVGQVVGEYCLQTWLGGGGFGNVYLAHHVRDNREVAIKILNLSGRDQLRDFINEVRSSRLSHPHIMPLLDFGLSREDEPFLVMEYAPRGTLRNLHPRGSRVPLATAVSYADQVAAALYYAHEQHVVHRDVKPENMLMRADNSILLSDFGISTIAHTTQSLSIDISATVVGTIPYMAPELLEGKPRPASDQYALGIVIYEWLTGACPFQGTALDIALQHSTKIPPSLLAQVPNLPAEVEEVIFKALAKDHKERFATIKAFANALQQANSPIYDLPIAKVIHGVEQRSSAGPIVPLVGPQSLVPGRQLQRQGSQPHMQDLQLHMQRAESQMQDLQPGPLGPQLPVVLPSELVGLPAEQTSKNIPPANLGPGNTPHTPAKRPGRELNRYVLIALLLIVLVIAGGGYTLSTAQTQAQQAQATARAVIAEATARVAPTATASAAIAAYTRGVSENGIMFGFDARHTHNNPYEHILSAATVATLHAQRIFPIGKTVDSSPALVDGVLYVGARDGNLYAFDVQSGRLLWRVFAHSEIADSSPAVVNGVVYIGAGDGNLYAFNTADGHPRWEQPAHTGGYINSSPVVVGDVVYVGSDDGNVYAFNVANGHPGWGQPAHTGGSIISSPAVAGDVVYASSEDGNLYAFSVKDGQQLWVSSLHARSESSPAVVGDVVYVGSDDTNVYAFAAGVPGGALKWVAHTGGIVRSSPAVVDGVVYVGAGDGNLYAFNTADGHQSWKEPAHTGGLIRSSPLVANGLVYVGSNDGHVYAIDATTGEARWDGGAGGRVRSSPLVANGLVYVGSSDGNLHTFSL